MRAQHDDFATLVGTRNLGDGVVGVGIGIVELVADVDLQLDGNLAVEQARETSIVFDGHHQRGDTGGIARHVSGPALHEDSATVSAAAGIDDGGDVLVHEELVQRLLEGNALGDFFATVARLLPGDFVLRQISASFLSS